MIDRPDRLKLTIIAAVSCVFLCVNSSEAAKRSSPSKLWASDFNAAQKQARRLNRPLIVHFYADWCAPCKRMDRETLHSASFVRQTSGRFVAVKINIDKHPRLAKRFNVSALPSDVFLDPSGKILARAAGYQSSRQYLARVAHVDASFAKSQKTIVAKRKNTTVRKTGGQPRVAAKTTPSVSRTPRSDQTIGMGEFSPVALWNHRTWIEGKVAYAHRHQGVTFYMADANELRQFRANPDRYVPKLLGCDPVVLNETDRAIAGNIDFGAYFDGKLYFFVDAESRKKFRAKPLRYTHTRHVLKIDHIGGTARR